MQNKRNIQPGLGISVGCANKGILSQTGQGELPLDNVPKGTENVKLFHDMHPSLLCGGISVKKGCTLLFGHNNTHIVKGELDN